MAIKITIPYGIYSKLNKHLFQGDKEQGAFLFAQSKWIDNIIHLKVEDLHLIQPSGWDIQESYYLELNDHEKVKIMNKAKRKNYDLIECHSHRNTDIANFSYTDTRGLEEFISYIKWKLPDTNYGALVCTETSIHGQIWTKTESFIVSKADIVISTWFSESISGLEKIFNFFSVKSGGV